MFGATEETFKSCSTCDLSRTDNGCLDEIMTAIRHYVYQKVVWAGVYPDCDKPLAIERWPFYCRPADARLTSVIQFETIGYGLHTALYNFITLKHIN